MSDASVQAAVEDTGAPHRIKIDAGRIYAIPLGLGVSTVLGLVSALVGDGVWDWVSWLALGTPTAIGIYYSFRRS